MTEKPLEINREFSANEGEPKGVTRGLTDRESASDYLSGNLDAARKNDCEIDHLGFGPVSGQPAWSWGRPCSLLGYSNIGYVTICRKIAIRHQQYQTPLSGE